MLLQAEGSSKADQLKEIKQQLAEAVGVHQRQSIEAEARSKSEAADAVRQKSEELMQQKELLDRYVFTSLTVAMYTAMRIAMPHFMISMTARLPCHLYCAWLGVDRMLGEVTHGHLAETVPLCERKT